MDYKKLIPKIFQKIKKSPRSFEAYNDLFTICRSMESENHKMAHDTNAELRRYIVKGLKRCHHQDAENFYSLYKKSLLFDAPHIFDAYLLYLEINRKPEERFYQPRRKVLKEVADALQRQMFGLSRMSYAYSRMQCLPPSMVSNNSIATGRLRKHTIGLKNT